MFVERGNASSSRLTFSKLLGFLLKFFRFIILTFLRRKQNCRRSFRWKNNTSIPQQQSFDPRTTNGHFSFGKRSDPGSVLARQKYTNQKRLQELVLHKLFQPGAPVRKTTSSCCECNIRRDCGRRKSRLDRSLQRPTFCCHKPPSQSNHEDALILGSRFLVDN